MSGKQPVEPTERLLPSSFDDDNRFREGGINKVVRKIREQPLVPLGAALTCYALLEAFRAIRRGDSQRAQRMFRARVMAQGFTVLAIMAGGAYYRADRAQTAELRALKSKRDAEERRIKWIRELEARDEEDKASKRAADARRAARRAARGDVAAAAAAGAKPEEVAQGKQQAGEAGKSVDEDGERDDGKSGVMTLAAWVQSGGFRRKSRGNKEEKTGGNPGSEVVERSPTPPANTKNITEAAQPSEEEEPSSPSSRYSTISDLGSVIAKKKREKKEPDTTSRQGERTKKRGASDDDS